MFFGSDSFGPPPIVFLPFVIVGGIMLFIIGRLVFHSAKNASSPLLSRQARVVAKRQHVWGDHARTSYYATFEFPDGAREELQVPAQQSGYLVEGDEGTVHSQGTWFKGFDRKPPAGLSNR